MLILEGKVLAIDSMILIYALEKRAPECYKIIEILEHAEKIILSSLVIGEVLTGMYRKRNEDELSGFFDFIQTQKNIEIKPFDYETSIRFAEIRSSRMSIKAPDCILLATALQVKADFFLTNDKKIKSLEGLKVIHLEDI